MHQQFLAGVVEGFYGQPWSDSERTELFASMAVWGLNTYVYAPKDDLYHRACWRRQYPEREAVEMGALVQTCRSQGVRFIYAISPGLDLRYEDEAEVQILKSRLDQVLAFGCEDFALLFDDIPDSLSRGAAERWGSFGRAQAHIANLLREYVSKQAPTGRFLFCPTAYCSRMAAGGLGGANYLETIGRVLSPEIDVLWTGPEIISPEISVTHVREVRTLLRRKPVIWDNLHANDYDGRRFYCGPYSGREPELRNEVGGLLANPNVEFPLNYVPLRTLGRFVQCGGEWKEREEYLSAIREWLPRFESVGRPVSASDLALLGDCYYLPHREGPDAEALYRDIAQLLVAKAGPQTGGGTAFLEKSRQLKQTCAAVTEVKYRPLFHALSRRLWELREELDLLERFVCAAAGAASVRAVRLRSDFHLPGTYRGGLVARLQRLLVQTPAGSFHPASTLETDPLPCQ